MTVVTPTLTAKDILEQTLEHLTAADAWVKGDWLWNDSPSDDPEVPKRWKACSMGAMILVEHINAYGDDNVVVDNWTEKIHAFSDRDPQFAAALLALARTIQELHPERGGVEDILEEIRESNAYNEINEPVEIGIGIAHEVVINFNDNEDTSIADIREVFTQAKSKL